MLSSRGERGKSSVNMILGCLELFNSALSFCQENQINSREIFNLTCLLWYLQNEIFPFSTWKWHFALKMSHIYFLARMKITVVLFAEVFGLFIERKGGKKPSTVCIGLPWCVSPTGFMSLMFIFALQIHAKPSYDLAGSQLEAMIFISLLQCF